MRHAAASLLLGALAAAAIAGDDAHEVEFAGALLGEEHPDVRLPTIDRESWTAISDFRGKKVLLIEFASW